MKILGVLICGQHPENNETYILKEEYFLDSVSFFARGSVKGTFKFVCRSSLQELEIGTRHTVKQDDHMCYIQVDSDSKAKLAAYAFCDAEYPSRVAQEFVMECVQAFKQEIGTQWVQVKSDQNIKQKEIEEKLVKFQNPKNVDKLVLLESQLEDTKEILHDNLNKLLERQGDLDKIAAKSTDLNVAAKQMYKQSKKTNKGCCTIF